MAQSVSLWGATYNNVPAIDVPKSPSGTARFTDVTPTTAGESDVASGKVFFKSDGTQATGTNSGGGSSKNVQIAAGVNRVATTSYTAISGQEIEVAKTGTYDVYWTGYRSSTSGTNGTQLYINGTAYGSAQTSFSNNAQAVHLTNVSLTAGQTITLRGRSRNTSYYMYGGNLTIVEK